ncbi:MAG TPA: zf-HC2 domain-containing protein [Ktedonobacterales bacterium]|nr:zf-HC2 domain-containing protein [Ktedonobacterales bacterium]
MTSHDDASLSCQELVELITDYFEGAISPEERARFEAHLGGCAGCQGYLNQLQRTIRLLGTLTEENIPDDARDYLLGVFRDWKRENEN